MSRWGSAALSLRSREQLSLPGDERNWSSADPLSHFSAAWVNGCRSLLLPSLFPFSCNLSFLQLHYCCPYGWEDGSITAITGGVVISLWLRLMILSFMEGTCTPRCDALTVRSTHTHTHCKETFHDIIGFIRSRPTEESGPVAGLMSMLSTAEG